MSALRFRPTAWATILLGGSFVVLACVADQNGFYIDTADTPPGGVPVVPNDVTCGAVAAGCPVAEGEPPCCAGPGVPGGGLCLLEAGAPCPAQTGAIFCNETADCNVPHLCCGTIDPAADAGGNVSTACETTCPAPKMQFCRTNGECMDSAKKCIVQKCSDGLTYEMCGVFSPPGGVFTCKAQ